MTQMKLMALTRAKEHSGKKGGEVSVPAEATLMPSIPREAVRAFASIRDDISILQHIQPQQAANACSMLTLLQAMKGYQSSQPILIGL